MNIKEKIGSRIRELRLEKKLSQTDLAVDAEINRGYLSAVEKGTRNISAVNLEKIIKALDTNFEEFFKYQYFRNN
jgi:transcriptional regulator with XRE-family HTH domain